MLSHSAIKILLLLTCFIPLCLLGAEWDDPALPMADPSKPVLQAVVPGVLGVGGIHKEVRIPSTDDLRERLKLEREMDEHQKALAQIDLAHRIILFGIAVFVFAGLCHAMNSLPVIDRICEYVMTFGVGSMITGILYKFYITNETKILWFVVLPLIIAGLCAIVLSRPEVRKWSISRFPELLRKKEKNQ